MLTDSRRFDVDDGSATGSIAPCVASSGDSLTTSASSSSVPASCWLPPETEPVPPGWSDAAGSGWVAAFGLRPHAEHMDDVSATVAATHITKKDSAMGSWPKACAPSGGGGGHLTIATGGIPATRELFLCLPGKNEATCSSQASIPARRGSLPFPNWKLVRAGSVSGCVALG